MEERKESVRSFLDGLYDIMKRRAFPICCVFLTFLLYLSGCGGGGGGVTAQSSAESAGMASKANTSADTEIKSKPADQTEESTPSTSQASPAQAITVLLDSDDQDSKEYALLSYIGEQMKKELDGGLLSLAVTIAYEETDGQGGSAKYSLIGSLGYCCGNIASDILAFPSEYGEHIPFIAELEKTEKGYAVLSFDEAQTAQDSDPVWSKIKTKLTDKESLGQLANDGTAASAALRRAYTHITEENNNSAEMLVDIVGHENVRFIMPDPIDATAVHGMTRYTLLDTAIQFLDACDAGDRETILALSSDGLRNELETGDYTNEKYGSSYVENLKGSVEGYMQLVNPYTCEDGYGIIIGVEMDGMMVFAYMTMESVTDTSFRVRDVALNP